MGENPGPAPETRFLGGRTVLKITSVEDLKEYLEVRREMAHKQINSAM